MFSKVKQDSELGALLTTNEYLAGFKTRVTNPRGLQTTSFYAWDTPTQDYPLKLVHPESAVTTILRDVYGKPKEITRYHVNTALGWQRRYFQYNANQELCSRTEGETGTTAMGYDAAGNLAWSAGGQSWSQKQGSEYVFQNSTTPCRVEPLFLPRGRLPPLSATSARGRAEAGLRDPRLCPDDQPRHLLITPTTAGAVGRMMQSVGRRHVRYVNAAIARTL